MEEAPLKDSSDLNIMNFISVVSLIVVKVWLIKDTLISLIADTTVNTDIEYTVKCTTHKFLPVGCAVYIHLLRLMDEYVRISHIEIWLRHLIDPVSVDVRITLDVEMLTSVKYNINISGVAHWTVSSNAQFSHFSSSVTPGNHQWRGVAPLFNGRG